MLAAVDTEGRPGLAWRAQHAAAPRRRQHPSYPTCRPTRGQAGRPHRPVAPARLTVAARVAAPARAHYARRHDRAVAGPVRAHAPVHATVRLPGSKSQTNRALVLAALAATPSTLVGPLVSRDTALMAAGLRAHGHQRRGVGGDWRSRPAPLRGPAEVDVGNAGTVMRFLPPVAALADGDVRFDGDPRRTQRPLAPVVAALRDLGADVDGRTTTGCRSPCTAAAGCSAAASTIDASPSSQFVSALLLAAPALRRRASRCATAAAGCRPARTST